MERTGRRGRDYVIRDFPDYYCEFSCMQMHVKILAVRMADCNR